MANSHSEPPAHSNQLKVSIPVDHVLVLAMNRPEALNAMSNQLENDIKNTLNWFDEQPDLWWVHLFSTLLRIFSLLFINVNQRVAIITGEGRAFCAGADLKE